MLDNQDHVVLVSELGKTWLIDLDGTVVKHNGYKTDGKDTFLEGAKEFLLSVSPEDVVIFLTSRTTEYARMTETFLEENGIRYDRIMYGLPYGERILVNDCKPRGLRTAIAVNTKRDQFMQSQFRTDPEI